MEKDRFIKIEPKLDTSLIDTDHWDKTSNSKLSNSKDPYHWLEPDDLHRYQTDAEILRTRISLKESALIAKDKSHLMTLLLGYKKAFHLRDEIGECPNIKACIQVIDNSQFLLDLLKSVRRTNLLWINRFKDLFLWAY